MHINKCLFGDDGIGFPFKHETVSISGCWMAGWSAVCQVKVARIIIYKSFRVFLFIHLIAPPLFSSNPSYDGPEGGLFCGFSSAVNNFNEFVGLKSVESFVPFRLWVRVCVFVMQIRFAGLIKFPFAHQSHSVNGMDVPLLVCVYVSFCSFRGATVMTWTNNIRQMCAFVGGWNFRGLGIIDVFMLF